METDKAKLLEEIDALKRDKPEGWKQKVRAVCRQLAELEGSFERERAIKYPVSEMRGRHARLPWHTGPDHDSFTDRSFP